MWKCEKCGEQYPDTERTCWLCGTRHNEGLSIKAVRNDGVNVPFKKRGSKGALFVISMLLVIFLLGWFIIANKEEILPVFDIVKEAFTIEKSIEDIQESPKKNVSGVQDLTSKPADKKVPPQVHLPDKDRQRPPLDNSLAPYKFGMSLMDQGLFEEAVTQFSKAIRENPASYDAYYNRGCAYKALGRFDDALADFKAAGKLKSGKSSTNP